MLRVTLLGKVYVDFMTVCSHFIITTYGKNNSSIGKIIKVFSCFNGEIFYCNEIVRGLK